MFFRHLLYYTLKKSLFSGADEAAETVNSVAADIDGDGKIAVNDLVLLNSFVLGKISNFPNIKISE